jgi:hypothetical protein
MNNPAQFHDAEGVTVEAVRIDSADDIRQIRALESWHEGQVRMLTYPSHEPALFVGDDNNDLARFGRRLILGQYLVKGPAGDIETMPAATFDATYTLGAAA